MFLEPKDLSGDSVKRSHSHILNPGANLWKQRRSEGEETKEKRRDFVSKNPSHSVEWKRERFPEWAPGCRSFQASVYHTEVRKETFVRKGK